MQCRLYALHIGPKLASKPFAFTPQRYTLPGADTGALCAVAFAASTFGVHAAPGQAPGSACFGLSDTWARQEARKTMRLCCKLQALHFARLFLLALPQCLQLVAVGRPIEPLAQTAGTTCPASGSSRCGELASATRRLRGSCAALQNRVERGL